MGDLSEQWSMSFDDKNNESDSNVWASYSDLFTNVAIIFLVMFVFALIKATMSQVKSVQTTKKHENELKAKLSKKEIQQGKDRVAKVERAVEEMKQYEQIIDQKVLELNSYAKKLQSNKTVLKEMIESQGKQDSLLKFAEESLSAKQKEILAKDLKINEGHKRIEVLNDEINRIQEDFVKRESLISRSVASEKKEMEASKEKLENVRKDMILEQKKLESQILATSQELNKAKAEVAKMESELKVEKKLKTSHQEIVGQLNRQLEGIEKELQENKLAAMKLSSDKSQLNSQLHDIGNQQNALKAKYEELERNFTKTNGDKRNLEGELAQLKSKSSETEKNAKKWQDEFENKIVEAEKLKGLLHQSNLRFRQLADTMSKLKDSVKNGVAVKLKEKFDQHNLNAKVDMKTGEVILLSGEGFNFEKGSTRISKEGKALLKKIIPVYSEVLLGDEKVYSQISLINMEGHSSPSFGGKYITPVENHPDAYSFNMRLSALRASSVASYLMSNEIGDYPHKKRMKSLLQSVGMAYMKPIPLDNINRLPASDSRNDCGPWDCYKSQRVQINFLLRDNMEEIKRIIDANGEIK